MYLDNSVKSGGPAMPDRSEALLQGLTLLRASALKMIRLQLALVRDDRRIALQALDDLMALDHQLEDHLNAIPLSSDELARWSRLNADTAALRQEKLTVAAEILCRRTNGTEQLREDEESIRTEPVGEAPDQSTHEVEHSHHRRSLLVVAAVLLLVMCVAAGLLIVPGTPSSLGQLEALLR